VVRLVKSFGVAGLRVEADLVGMLVIGGGNWREGNQWPYLRSNIFNNTPPEP